MCLILFSYKKTPGFRLILGANRDEFLSRPTLPLNFLDTGQTILAGHDKRGGGTWLGVNVWGKIAAITNYRAPGLKRKSDLSRGLILHSYLNNNESPEDFLFNLSRDEISYEGFNLIVGDKNELYYYSNINKESKRLVPGLYGLSNHLLDTAWPKVERGKTKFAKAVVPSNSEMIPDIFELLRDTCHPLDRDLPETGVGLEWERLLSSIFITAPTYGTRSSAVLTITDTNTVQFRERTFSHSSKGGDVSGREEFEFVTMTPPGSK